MDEKKVSKNRVKELRKRLAMRQSDLAEEAGVTRQTILAIEKGRLNPSISIALQIGRVLHEPVDYVFFLAPDDGASVYPPAAYHGLRGRLEEALEPAAVWDFA